MKSKVLILEDEYHVVNEIKRSIRNLTSEVQVAQSFDAALEILGKEPADHRANVCLTDIKLARYDGIDAARIIFHLYSVPTLFVTAFPAERERTMFPGAFGFVQKPFSPETLSSAVLGAIYNFENFERSEEAMRLGIGIRGNIVSTNRSVEKLLGQSRIQILSQTFVDLFAPDSVGVINNLMSETLQRRSFSGGVAFIKVYGAEAVPIIVKAHPITHDNRIIGVHVSCRHIPSAAAKGLQADEDSDKHEFRRRIVEHLLREPENYKLVAEYDGKVVQLAPPGLSEAVLVEFTGPRGRLKRLFPIARLARIRAAFVGAELKYGIYECGNISFSFLDYAGPDSDTLLRRQAARIPDELLEEDPKE